MKTLNRKAALCLFLALTLIYMTFAGKGLHVQASPLRDGLQLSDNADGTETEQEQDIVILYTSDVHCGIDQGFGYAGLVQVRDYLVSQGNAVILVDNGDSIQGELIAVHPFSSELCMITVTGQQVLDALEWGARAVPGENGGFLQVSGMTYEINTSVESSCLTDENGGFSGIEGSRRVQNVMVGGEPLDPEKTYTLAGTDYTLLEKGDGYTMFEGAEILLNRVKLDYQVLLDYITGTLGGVIGEEYEDPYGQGRIVFVEQ